MPYVLPGSPTLTRLGELVDIVVDQGDEDQRITPSTSTALLWHPQGRRLAWWMGWDPQLQPGEPATRAERAAARNYRRWGVWEAGAIGKSSRKGATQWDSFPALSIGYRSDKFGRPVVYEHEFGRRVMLYRPLGAAGPWVIKGGNLRLTARGLVG